MARKLNILVPRFVDAGNLNAQNLNAKALLSRFREPDVTWHTLYTDTPDPRVSARPNVVCHRLLKGRGWAWHVVAQYQKHWDAIFYPGNEWMDVAGLRLRASSGRRIPVIGTLEGLPGDEERERYLSVVAGHPVKCFRPRGGPRYTRTHDAVKKMSDLNIALSPFLAQLGKATYGGRFLTLPIGVESSVFNANGRDEFPRTPLVVGAGTVYEAKRPDVFLWLAAQMPAVKFVWYGNGPLQQTLKEGAESKGLRNLEFHDAVSVSDLARKFRSATVLVLPSLSEGVPKVTQEAISCGLPVVLFGHYEAPTVIDGYNGYVVWNDDQLLHRLREIVGDPDRWQQMGRAGTTLAAGWPWDLLTERWEWAVLTELDRMTCSRVLR